MCEGTPAGPERRRFGRRTVFKPASIISDGAATTACIVVDISDGGARLKVTRSEDVADHFGLAIEEDDFGVWCQVVRREGDHVAVRFIGSPRRLSWLRRRSRIKDQMSDIIRSSADQRG